ncbi:MAG: peptidoglycan-binding domain-containing protein [Candidatus Paceibacterota bacterium]
MYTQVLVAVPTALIIGFFVSAFPAFANHSATTDDLHGTDVHTRGADDTMGHTVAPVTASRPLHVLSTDCVISKTLGVGSRGDEVACLQDMLMAYGYLTSISAPTGYFGPLTAAALSMWQSANDVPSTGYFGTLSLAALAHSLKDTVSHDHVMIDVSEWPLIPEIEIALHKDALAGWNLEIDTEHFTFTPATVNEDNRENEGHAHIYIDGVKLARVYGHWFHIPDSAILGAGEHTVSVSLNANDHSGLTHGDEPITDEVTINIHE